MGGTKDEEIERKVGRTEGARKEGRMGGMTIERKIEVSKATKRNLLLNSNSEKRV